MTYNDTTPTNPLEIPTKHSFDEIDKDITTKKLQTKFGEVADTTPNPPQPPQETTSDKPSPSTHAQATDTKTHFNNLIQQENTHLRKPRTLSDILQLLQNNPCEEISLHEIARETKIDKNTAKTYLEILEKHQLIGQITPFGTNKASISNKKRYFLKHTPSATPLNEVVNHLTSRGWKVQFWRPKPSRHCLYIISNKDTKLALNLIPHSTRRTNTRTQTLLRKPWGRLYPEIPYLIYTTETLQNIESTGKLRSSRLQINLTEKKRQQGEILLETTETLSNVK